MSKFRILSIFLAVGLLVGALGVGPILAGQIDVTGLDTRDASYAPYALDVDEGEVEWATGVGADVAAAAYANDDQMAVFYINDDDLEGTSNEHSATWNSGAVDTNGVTQGFNVQTGAVRDVAHIRILTAVDGDGVAATTTFAGFAGMTPIHSVTKITVVANGATSTLTRQALESPDNNLVKVLGGTVPFDYVQIRFKHHEVDSYDERARVVSTSDPQGELVTVGEVAGTDSSDSSADSDVFRGSVQLSKDPGTQGPGEDESSVWVQDGDTLTVHYLDEDGDIVDSDSITVDAAKPVIDNITPADGTHTSVTNPTLLFDATDAGSGYDAKRPADFFDVYVGTEVDADGDLITTTAKGAGAGRVEGDPVGGVRLGGDSGFELSPVPISGGYRVIFTTSESWLDSDVFGDHDDSGQLNVTLVARDIARNEAVTTISVTIDTGPPVTVSAETGIGWDNVKEEETTGVMNGVKLVMNEAIDPDSVQATDFEIDSQAAADAVVGSGEFKRVIYLTAQSDFDADARPDVEVVGEVKDLSGNEVDTDATTAERKNAKDNLKPTATVSRDNVLLVEKDDEVTITIESDEKLKSSGGAVVSIFGPDSGTAANLAAEMADADAPQTHSLTHAIGAEAATGKYGISVKVTDLGNNYSTNLESASNEEADVEDGVITVANGPIADDDVDGDIDEDDITLEVKDSNGNVVATSTHITAVDASARTITISATDGATAVVSYSYAAADHTFEIDMSAPAAEFSVADESKITNNSPFIKVSLQ